MLNYFAVWIVILSQSEQEKNVLRMKSECGLDVHPTSQNMKRTIS